jgi:hypothetical protein
MTMLWGSSFAMKVQWHQQYAGPSRCRVSPAGLVMMLHVCTNADLQVFAAVVKPEIDDSDHVQAWFLWYHLSSELTLHSIRTSPLIITSPLKCGKVDLDNVTAPERRASEINKSTIQYF